jgi:hypothetical protein
MTATSAFNSFWDSPDKLSFSMTQQPAFYQQVRNTTMDDNPFFTQETVNSDFDVNQFLSLDGPEDIQIITTPGISLTITTTLLHLLLE